MECYRDQRAHGWDRFLSLLHRLVDIATILARPPYVSPQLRSLSFGFVAEHGAYILWQKDHPMLSAWNEFHRRTATQFSRDGAFGVQRLVHLSMQGCRLVPPCQPWYHYIQVHAHQSTTVWHLFPTHTSQNFMCRDGSAKPDIRNTSELQSWKHIYLPYKIHSCR